MTINNIWIWSFLECQSFRCFETITLKTTSPTKLTCIFPRKWPHWTWPWPIWPAMLNVKFAVGKWHLHHITIYMFMRVTDTRWCSCQVLMYDNGETRCTILQHYVNDIHDYTDSIYSATVKNIWFHNFINFRYSSMLQAVLSRLWFWGRPLSQQLTIMIRQGSVSLQM